MRYIRHMRRSVFTALMIASLLPGIAHAEGTAIKTPFDLDAAGWEVLTFSGKDPARFIGMDDGTLEVFTLSSTAILYRDIEDMANGTDTLRWSWRVNQAPPATDLSAKGGDDRALALHLWFPESGGHRPGLFTRIGRGLARAAGVPVPGHAITYVWGGDDEAGTMFPNPYFEDGVIVVLEPASSPLDTWEDENINWRQDFENAFGFEAPTPHYIGLSADTDDTGTGSQGFFKNIVFE